MMSKYEAFDPGGMNSFYGTIVSISPQAALSLGSMEGMVDTAVLAPPRPSLRDTFLQSPWLGYLAAGAVALGAYALDVIKIPYLSLTLTAIILGMLVRNTLPVPATVSIGCKKIVRTLVPIAIVCTGASLSFTELRDSSASMVGITIACVLIALGSTYWIGRRLGLTKNTATLLGIGTGICGSSAIVAAAPLVEADDEDMVLSIGAVNLFGIVMMLLLPAVGAALALTGVEFGLWAGTTIHAVPQVLAAATGFGDGADATQALQIATLVKLGRVAMLAPVVFMLALATASTRSGGGARRIHYTRLVPWFVWGFLIVALLNTLGLLPRLDFTAMEQSFELSRVLDKGIGKLLLTVALAAIGLEVRLRSLITVGGRAVLAGLISSLLLAGASLALILLLA